jgi:hypothetical protein
MAKLPKIPKLLDRKIYKTGQTRGADDDQIFQNRVGRNSTVLIPLSIWISTPSVKNIQYENGYIVLITPTEYFQSTTAELLTEQGLELGINALIYYEKRDDWNHWNPLEMGLTEPTSRKGPLGGQFISRIANTTASNDERINIGYTTTGLKGAGIRLYEYADPNTIAACRIQLEAVFWCTVDATEKMIAAGMTEDEILIRKTEKQREATEANLFDHSKLVEKRILNSNSELVCPLCLEPISAAGFLSRLPQATGRERHDLTVTEINLFHIDELAYGKFNHKQYNLGWGHHHCNVVCKDSGITDTLEWMKSVLERNKNIS